jgi:hypothetical protein
MNLLPMLQASLGISIKSDGDRLKVGLFTVFACVQPAFKNAAAVPREASKAHIHHARLSLHQVHQLHFQYVLNAYGMSSDEGVISSELAPTELKTSFNRCMQRLPKFKHVSRRSFKDFCSFVFLSASASYFACKFFFSCSKFSDFSFKAL